MIFLDLVTDKGQLIRVECPDEHEDALWDSIINSLKLGDMWSTNRFDGCNAEFHGMRIDRIDMSKIIGTL